DLVQYPAVWAEIRNRGKRGASIGVDHAGGVAEVQQGLGLAYPGPGQRGQRGGVPGGQPASSACTCGLRAASTSGKTKWGTTTNVLPGWACSSRCTALPSSAANSERRWEKRAAPARSGARRPWSRTCRSVTWAK